MGYSKARLEHALRVFRRSSSYRRRKGLQNSNRELRRTTRSSRAGGLQPWSFFGGPEDGDDGDEYDPIEDRRRLKALRRKKKIGAEKRKMSVAGDDENVPVTKKGGEGHLVLKLTSLDSQRRLAELLHGPRTKLESFDPEPIEIDSSDEESGNSSLDFKHESGISMASNKPLVTTQPIQASLSPFYGSKVESFKTWYANPINFKLIPGKDGTSECDFCKDWTMAVLGHGLRRVTATRDPRRPTEYQEIANGHRSGGKDPTQMCVSCSLDRLLIMRCHSPHHQPGRPLLISTGVAPFSKIHSRDIPRPQSFAYLRYLFCRMHKETHLISPKYPLPACNLCPNFASWRCCKYQERDKARRLCQVPKVDRRTQMNINSAVINPSSSSSLTRATSTSNMTLAARSSTQSRPKSAEPVVISLLDSSDDEEDDIPTKSTLPVPTPTISGNQTLRPPLRGCGLHLCETCHAFIVQSCKGLLPETRVLDYLESTRLGPRADVQWLFKGSLLEESFESGRR